MQMTASVPLNLYPYPFFKTSAKTPQPVGAAQTPFPSPMMSSLPVAPAQSPDWLSQWNNSNNAPYRFAVIGDAGTGDQNQAAVARQLSIWQQATPFQSVMVLGDNVYQNGEPALFMERIARPYQDLFQRQVRFYPVLGNHDVKQGYGNWQLAYWGVPEFYHYKLGPTGAETDFWALDTNLLMPGPDEMNAENPAVRAQKAAYQLKWLDQTLASSTAPMKVVYGHHPMHSRGADAKLQRSWQQAVMAQQLGPLFEKYGVDLYMAGHEHHYEKPTELNGVYYLVSGAGGKLDTPTRGSREGNGLIKQLHMMLFEITPQGLAYRTISANGTLLDCGLIPRKVRPQPTWPNAFYGNGSVLPTIPVSP